MNRAVPRHIAIWIDSHHAILLASEAEPSDQSTLHRPGDGWSQDRVDARLYPSAQQYYGAVLSHLEPLDEILILGPGRAKLELRHQIEEQGGLRGKVVGLHKASRLAEVEVIFPTSEVWRSEKAGKARVDSPIPRPAPRLAERMRVQR
jgi:hypothetical protein